MIQHKVLDQYLTSGSLQDFCIRDLVLPPDPEEFSQAVLVEVVKSFGMALVPSPSPTCV